MVTVDDVRAVAAELPRSYEVVVRGRIKFRVGQIVYLAFSKDETLMGFGFPKSEREYLVQTDPETFMLPDETVPRVRGDACRGNPGVRGPTADRGLVRAEGLQRTGGVHRARR